MGYKLTSILNLPFDESIRLYLFYIGEELWEGGLQEVVHKNFDRIAREIGPDAIIVGALQDEFHGGIVQTYLGKNYHELKNEMPALLITDSHPNVLTEKSLRILIPLRDVQEHYIVIDQFLSDLAAFARGESDILLQRLEEGIKPVEVAAEVIRVSYPIIPGFVAVNLNHAIKQLRKWWNSKKHRVT